MPQYTTSNTCILGLGNFSTLYFIKRLNTLYEKKKGKSSTCPFFMLNTNFKAINDLLPRPRKALTTLIDTYLKEIKKNKAIKYVVIPNITLNKIIEKSEIIKNKDLKLIHPIKLTVDYLIKNKITNCNVFGSYYTMKISFLEEYFKPYGIRLNFPEKNEIKQIDVIRKAVFNDQLIAKEKKIYLTLVEKYTKKEPLLIACTELTLITPISPLIIDMLEIQAQAVIS